MGSIYVCKEEDCQLVVPENGQIVKGCSGGKSCELVAPGDIGMSVVNEEVGPGVVLKDYTCMLSREARELIECTGSGCALACQTGSGEPGEAVSTHTATMVGLSVEDCRSACCAISWCRAFDVDDASTCRLSNGTESAKEDGYTTYVVKYPPRPAPP